MKLAEFRFLADENIHADVVQYLTQQGFDVLDVFQAQLVGSDDETVLRRAAAEDRVVLTHDRDFGTLAVLAGCPVVGIVYLRPGHINPQFTIASLQGLLLKSLDLTPPFILVAQRRGPQLTVRLRRL